MSTTSPKVIHFNRTHAWDTPFWSEALKLCTTPPPFYSSRLFFLCFSFHVFNPVVVISFSQFIISLRSCLPPPLLTSPILLTFASLTILLLPSPNFLPLVFVLESYWACYLFSKFHCITFMTCSTDPLSLKESPNILLTTFLPLFIVCLTVTWDC